MKNQILTFVIICLLSVPFSGCWELASTETSCQECQEAMDHLYGAVNSGRLSCIGYVNSTAFNRVITNCKNGRDKAYAIVDVACSGFGSFPSACN